MHEHDAPACDSSYCLIGTQPCKVNENAYIIFFDPKATHIALRLLEFTNKSFTTGLRIEIFTKVSIIDFSILCAYMNTDYCLDG